MSECVYCGCEVNDHSSSCPTLRGYPYKTIPLQKDQFVGDFEQHVTPVFDDGYDTVRRILEDAVRQTSQGKGKRRHHVDGEKFEEQQICEMARRLSGHVAGGPLYQAVKKIYESGRLNPVLAKKELLGAINYIVAAVKIIEEKIPFKEE